MNPLLKLKGKLNHLHLQKTYVMKIIQTANSVPLVPARSESTLAEQTVESILALSSPEK